MTDGLLESFGDPDRSRGAAAFSRTAHALPVVASGIYGWWVAEDVVGQRIGPSWLSLTMAAAGVVVLLVALTHHDTARLCLRCMQDVPADAPVRARRRKLLLWMEHHQGRVFLTGLALAATGAAVQLVLGMTPGPSWLRLPADLWWWAYIAASWVHHRLRPWCPYCRPWDDEGPREPSPTPDPRGVKTA